MFRVFFVAMTLVGFAGHSVAEITPWTEMKVHNGHIAIGVTVSGIETYAVLDTGSQLNAINRAFRTKNALTLKKGSKINLNGIHGAEKIDSFNKVPVSIFGVDIQLNRVADIAMGHHSQGILLGAEFLSQFVIQMDYPNQRIRFITHDSIDMAKLENIEFQQHKSQSMPLVKIGLGPEKETWVLFDTGNNGGVLFDKSFAQAMNWPNSLTETQSRSVGATSHVSVMSNYRIPELQFGPFTLENVLVSVPVDGKLNLLEQHRETGSRIRGKRVQGVLGYDVLQHFVITIDYKNGHAHIGLPQEQ
ncbi:MAG: aspartyl protease family protein [Rheinheimera sp.]|nr:aspartyl protease family protein [Rheinheimera sp.]